MLYICWSIDFSLLFLLWYLNFSIFLAVKASICIFSLWLLFIKFLIISISKLSNANLQFNAWTKVYIHIIEKINFHLFLWIQLLNSNRFLYWFNNFFKVYHKQYTAEYCCLDSHIEINILTYQHFTLVSSLPSWAILPWAPKSLQMGTAAVKLKDFYENHLCNSFFFFISVIINWD